MTHTLIHQFSGELPAAPEKFTYPFCYEPHPLAIKAAEQLQHRLENDDLWQQHIRQSETNEYGKMFGVLVIQDQNGQWGFLCAYSGKLADSSTISGFVPLVHDVYQDNPTYLAQSAQVNTLTTQIKNLENNDVLTQTAIELSDANKKASDEISALQQAMVISRKQRKAQREQLSTLSAPEKQEKLQHLAHQSIVEKRKLAQLKLAWQNRCAELETTLDEKEAQIAILKQQRASLSLSSQQAIFSQYEFFNAHGVKRNALEIFKAYNVTPPAGSGDCAAPKLLQYAFNHQLTPVCMAEFWWGPSPKSEIRQHKKYYPACQSKCFPLLTHMLEGLEVDDNPLLKNPAEALDFEIVYQDEAIVVVNKPADMLSVPGVHTKDSVASRLEAQFGTQCEGPFTLHRLDMSTSGLLVFALTRRANKQLQKQFIAREVKKYYVALISGTLDKNEGEILLPLTADLDDKPRQKVCESSGKSSKTLWEVIETYPASTKLKLTPVTGRTHQLRVHCAHPAGLNAPIVGDDLYGQKAQRLCLHAESLSFYHPYTREWVTFTAPCPF